MSGYLKTYIWRNKSINQKKTQYDKYLSMLLKLEQKLLNTCEIKTLRMIQVKTIRDKILNNTKGNVQRN